MKQLSMCVALLIVVAGCASSELPRAAVADAQGEIRAAEAVGAKDNANASLYLKLAKDQLAKAKEYAEDGDEEEARLLLDRAVVDAKVAIALTKKAEAEAEAKDVLNEINQLSQK